MLRQLVFVGLWAATAVAQFTADSTASAGFAATSPTFVASSAFVAPSYPPSLVSAVDNIVFTVTGSAAIASYLSADPAAGTTFLHEYSSLVVANPSYFAPTIRSEFQAGEPSVPTATALSIFATAVPSSLDALFQTNIASWSAVIAQEFAGGSKPAWFTDMPANVQTFIELDATTALTTAKGSVGAGAIGSAIRTVIVTVPASPAASTSAASTGGSSGLSTGAKAGIGAGVGVAALVAIILLIVFCLRSRSKKKRAQEMEGQNQQQGEADQRQSQVEGGQHPQYSQEPKRDDVYPGAVTYKPTKEPQELQSGNDEDAKEPKSGGGLSPAADGVTSPTATVRSELAGSMGVENPRHELEGSVPEATRAAEVNE